MEYCLSCVASIKRWLHDATAVSAMIWVDGDVILAKIWGQDFTAHKAQSYSIRSQQVLPHYKRETLEESRRINSSRVAGSSSSSIRVISSSFLEYSRNVSGIFEFIGYKIIILDMKVPFFEYSTSIFRHSSWATINFPFISSTWTNCSLQCRLPSLYKYIIVFRYALYLV